MVEPAKLPKLLLAVYSLRRLHEKLNNFQLSKVCHSLAFAYLLKKVSIISSSANLSMQAISLAFCNGIFPAWFFRCLLKVSRFVPRFFDMLSMF